MNKGTPMSKRTLGWRNFHMILFLSSFDWIHLHLPLLLPFWGIVDVFNIPNESAHTLDLILKLSMNALLVQTTLMFKVK